MKWVAISGSWRSPTAQTIADVKSDIIAIYNAGDGIVTGGALGVDYAATAQMLELDPTASRIKVFLPTSLTLYSAHYLRRADEGVITVEQARSLISQLEKLKQLNPDGLIELDALIVNEESYYARNTFVLEAAQALYAYQVNGSQGTQDAIDKAKTMGLDVTHRTYTT